MACVLICSVQTRPGFPIFLQTRRNAPLVTSAIGARMTGGSIRIPPMWNGLISGSSLSTIPLPQHPQPIQRHHLVNHLNSLALFLDDLRQTACGDHSRTLAYFSPEPVYNGIHLSGEPEHNAGLQRHNGIPSNSFLN